MDINRLQEDRGWTVPVAASVGKSHADRATVRGRVPLNIDQFGEAHVRIDADSVSFVRWHRKLLGSKCFPLLRLVPQASQPALRKLYTRRQASTSFSVESRPSILSTSFAQRRGVHVC